MANEYRFGQKGVSTDLQFGKRGPRLVANTTTAAMQVTAADGTTLGNMRIANAVIDSDAVNKAQLDAEVANISTNAYNITLGSGGDGSFSSPGSVTSLTSSTTVAEAIDRLNEVTENIRNNTYDKCADAPVDNRSGGNPLTVTLTISVVGNANRYTIDWGDGDTNITFATDRITQKAGNVEFIDFANTTQDYITLGGTSDIDARLQGGSGYVFVQGSNGYIGINDASPSFPLDISGNTKVSGNLTVSSNIGIGTDSPSYKLQVQGTGYFNSTLYVNGTTTINNNVNIFIISSSNN